MNLNSCTRFALVLAIVAEFGCKDQAAEMAPFVEKIAALSAQAARLQADMDELNKKNRGLEQLLLESKGREEKFLLESKEREKMLLLESKGREDAIRSEFEQLKSEIARQQAVEFKIGGLLKAKTRREDIVTALGGPRLRFQRSNFPIEAWTDHENREVTNWIKGILPTRFWKPQPTRDTAGKQLTDEFGMPMSFSSLQAVSAYVWGDYIVFFDREDSLVYSCKPNFLPPN